MKVQFSLWTQVVKQLLNSMLSLSRSHSLSRSGTGLSPQLEQAPHIWTQVVKQLLNSMLSLSRSHSLSRSGTGLSPQLEQAPHIYPDIPN